VQDLADLNKHNLKEYQNFFEVIKQLKEKSQRFKSAHHTKRNSMDGNLRAKNYEERLKLDLSSRVKNNQTGKSSA
jgi:inorganic pyrophosphatase